jgi:CBS domain-containing protein
MQMTSVRKLLESKGDLENYSININETVLNALKIMAEANIGALLVMDGKRVAGIFTERDYLLKGELEGRLAESTHVETVMTRNMYTVTSDTSAEQCMALMDTHHIRHLPVVDEDQLVGLVSIRDVMTAALENKVSEIKGLENYIMGSGCSG